MILALSGAEGESWVRFREQEGLWYGRSTQVGVNGNVIRRDQYQVDIKCAHEAHAQQEQLQELTIAPRADDEGHEEFSLFATYSVEPTPTTTATTAPATLKYEHQLRYKDTFVFGDGSYCGDHFLFEFPHAPLSSLSVEHCIGVSATERIRLFALYGLDRALERVIVCNEVRDSLWETRAPLSVVSLLGTWTGEARTKRSQYSGSGFLRFRTSAQFGWDFEKSVRRALHMVSMNDSATLSASSNNAAAGVAPPSESERISETRDSEEIEKKKKIETMQHRSACYGEYDGGNKVLYGAGNDTQVMVLLPHGCYCLCPATLATPAAWQSECACLVADASRKRISRLRNSENMPLSDTLCVESIST
mmetsp:Transcript_1889/g.4147  ORF Transcript_1889/g.4147 Transcript_1889/m.4147 type:complete len:363 (-) Transcript_1889:2044-3132(-)